MKTDPQNENFRPETFVPFTDDFDYEKRFYDVLVPSGEVVKNCWPNAGMMNAINGDSRKWSAADGVHVRQSENQMGLEDNEYPNVAVIGTNPMDSSLMKQLQLAAKEKGGIVVLDDRPSKLAFHELTPARAELDPILFRRRGPTKRERANNLLLAASLAAGAIASLPPSKSGRLHPKRTFTFHDLQQIRRAQEKRDRKAQRAKNNLRKSAASAGNNSIHSVQKNP